MDRADAAGLGVAAVGHAALLAAIVYLMDRTPEFVPPQPSVEVSFVEDAGLAAAAPSTEAPAPSGAPEAGPPEDAAPAPAEPLPEPTPAPPPPVPQAQPQPAPRPAQRAPAPRPQPPQQRTATPPRPQPPQQRNATPPRQQTQRQSGGGSQRRTTGPLSAANLNLPPAEGDGRSNQPAARVYSAQERASVFGIIQRALIPCERQPLPAPEAREIVVRVQVTLNRDGSLAGATARAINSDPQLRIYEERMKDLAMAVLRRCTPIRGLPAEFYDVRGGWRSFPYEFDPR